MAIQEEDLLLKSFLVKEGLLKAVNPSVGPPRPTIDQATDQSLRSFLKYQGYEIVGELPERPPVATPEMKQYVEKEFQPQRAGAVTQVPGKPEDPYPTISQNILGASPGFWKQAKDLATAWAMGKIDQTDIVGRDLFKGLTGGNIDPYDIVEKISGKPGFKKFAEAASRERITRAVGYEPKQAMSFAKGAGEAAGQMLLLVPILKGAGVAANLLPKIPMLRAVARGVVTGALSGAIQKPEQESLENRLKQIPPNVLFFTAFETLGVTAEQMLKIFKYNKKWGGYKPGARIEPISKVVPGGAREFTADEMKDLFRKQDANSTSAGGEWSRVTDREQDVIDTVARAPGWKQAIKEGFISPAVPETVHGWKVSPELIPRKPRMGDIFRNVEKLPRYEQFGYFKEYPEETWPGGARPKIAPETTGPTEGPSPVSPAAEPIKTPPRATEAQGQPSEAPPQVVLDVSRKPDGSGWTYTFKPGIAEAVPASVLEAISPETLKELPPHIQEIIKTKMPRGWSPRKARTFEDPLVNAIYKLGGIKPNKDFTMKSLKELGLPIGLIKNSGFPMDYLAQTLTGDYPELDTPYKPSDQALYDLLSDRNRGGRLGKERPPTADEVRSDLEDYYAERWFEGKLNRESLEPDEATLIQELKDKKRISDDNFGTSKLREGPMGEPLGEFEGPGYQGKDKEAIKEEYRKWLISEGVSPAAAKKQLSLFGGEFAPPEEPSLFKIPDEIVGTSLEKKLKDAKGAWEKQIDITDEWKVLSPKTRQQITSSGWAVVTNRQGDRVLVNKTQSALAEELRKKVTAKQEPLFELPKRESSIFDQRGLGKFKDINVWRKQVDPFIAQGYVVEYGHEGGTKGWARLIEKKKSGEGKLISRAIAIEGLPRAEAELLEEPFAGFPKGVSAFDTYLAGLKDAELSDKELKRHEGIIRSRAEDKGMTPDDYVVKYITGLEKKVEPVAPKETEKPTDFKLRRDLAEMLPRLNVPGQKWGEVTRRVLTRWTPEKGDLETYVKKIAFGRAPTGVPILTSEGEPWPKAEEIKEVPLEEIPERLRGEKEKAYGRFEMKQEEARLRDVVMKEAHDETDLDILESRFFKDPPESLEEIGTRHGIKRQAIDKRMDKLFERLKGNPDLLEILNKKYELHSFPGIVSEKDIKDLRNFINKYLRSSKGVSKEVDMENDERIGGILAEKFGATVEGKKLSKYIKEQGENPATLQYFKDLLEGGDIQASSLPEEIKRLLLSMRQRIDRLSDMIIANGGVPEKTKAVFEANKGRYLGKFYRLYEKQERARGRVVKKYWDPPKEVRDRFKAALKVQFPDTFGTYSEEELDNFLEGMVRETDFFSQGTKRTKKIPPEHYIHRIKLTPEYREFAGEIMDPRYLYLKTASEQGVMAYNGKMLKFLKDGYPDLWTDNLDKARKQGWQKSQLPSDWHSYGEMAGLYVHPDLNEYLRNEFFPSRSGMEHTIEKYIVNPFKWTKTIGSVPTHARNFLGNPMFSMLLRNSIWNPGNAGYYIKAAKIIVGREGKYAKEWEELVRHGVTETQFWGAEIPRFYEELLRVDPADWPERFFDAAVKRPMNKLSNAYNAEDAIYRIASHLKNTEHFHMTPKESVEELNLGMTNYRKLPTAVEILRRYPVFGPFVSFKANVVKIMLSQVERAVKDMGKKETRAKGVMRLFRWLAALSAPIILQEISEKVFDIDKKQKNIIEKYLPEWRKHGIYFYFRWKDQFPWFTRNKKYEAKVFDFTYIYPVGDIWQGVKAASKLDMAGVKNSMSLFYHPLLDLYSVLVQDRDPQWGTKLPGGFKEQIAKAITQVWLPASAPIPSLKALVHGDIRAGSLTPYQIKTLIDSWYGEAPIGKEPKKFTEELKNFLTGVRTFDLNPKQIMGTYLRSKRFEATDSMQEFRTWFKQNPNARDYEVKEKKAALLKRQKKIAEQLKQASIDYGILRKGGFALEPEKQ